MADSEESAVLQKKMVRASTVAQINTFMAEHAIGAEDDLDIVTFIFAAQAIKPGADQEELMNIFAAAEIEEDDVDTATKMHNLLKRISVRDASEGLAGSLGADPLDMAGGDSAPIFSHDAPTSDSEGRNYNDMPIRRASSARRRSVYEQAEFDATEKMARTQQKLDIAAEMIHLGHSAAAVASVTGLELGSINAIVNAAQFSPRKAQTLSPSQISDLIRLCNEGPDAIAAESQLAHQLLIAMKDQILNIAGSKTEMVTFESTMTSQASATVEEDVGEPDASPLPQSLGSGPDVAASSEGASAADAPLKYDLEFAKKPLGMSWNQTSDGKNLYVQDVLEGGLAQTLGVLVGSVIDSFNGEDVFGKGPEQIYQIFKKCALPIRIGFRRPVASSATDPNVIMLKEVTGLETETVIKLLHKFGGNVQAANEAFYIAKARTRQWISKQKVQQKDAPKNSAPPASSGKSKKKGKKWWKKWTKKVES